MRLMLERDDVAAALGSETLFRTDAAGGHLGLLALHDCVDIVLIFEERIEHRSPPWGFDCASLCIPLTHLVVNYEFMLISEIESLRVMPILSSSNIAARAGPTLLIRSRRDSLTISFSIARAN